MTTFAFTMSGRSTFGVSDFPRSDSEQIVRSLSLLDGVKNFSYVLWPIPAHLSMEDVDFGRDCEEFLQCAGTAARMTLEMRQVRDGVASHYVIGRQREHSGEPDEAVPWQEVTTMVYPDEVFSAEEATPLFVAYYQHRDVPGDFAKRLIKL